MRSAARTLTALGLLLAVRPLAAGDAKPLRVFISADMEGIAGVVNQSQLGPGAFTGKDVVEAVRFISFVTNYDANQ